jgi:uncharacterized protein
MLRRLLVLSIVLLVAAAASAQSRLFTEASKSIKWEPWGEAALARAKKENKPLFVSAGYVSANTWHLLQRDAFTLTDNAQTLNAEYVPVLVDQQLHPEVADALEVVLRTMNGTGGLPVNIVFTPDLEPFAAAGYVKAAELKTLLFASIQRWNNERDKVRAEGQTVLAKAREAAAAPAAQNIDENSLGAVIDAVAKTWDSKRGGFGREPKLLQPMTVSFLFAYAQQKRHEETRAVAIDTLKKIAVTPVHDQLGGGFHRGSLAADWGIPYFEKMLYDQALMSLAFLDAWKITREERLGNIARATVEAAMRDLRDKDGPAGFWTAQDAYNYHAAFGKPELSNGVFYVWDHAEIKQIFGAKVDLVFRLYGMSAEGNMPRGIDPALTGKNILWMREPELVREKNAELVPVLEKILKWRQGRPAPFRDDKVLAGWNGLMISALARTGAALKEDAYVTAATKAAGAVLPLWNAKTKTLSRAKNVAATVEDYTLLVQAFLDLYEATYDLRWYELATALQSRQDALFWDEKSARYTVGTSVPAQLRGLTVENDVDTPGPNGVAAMNLMRIATFSGQPAWRERAQMIFRTFAARLAADGTSLPHLATAFTASLATPKLVVIIPGRSSEQTDALLRAAHATYVPMRAIVRLPTKGQGRDRTLAMFPALKDLEADPEQATVYVCSGGKCERPSPEVEAMVKLLQ